MPANKNHKRLSCEGDPKQGGLRGAAARFADRIGLAILLGGLLLATSRIWAQDVSLRKKRRSGRTVSQSEKAREKA